MIAGANRVTRNGRTLIIRSSGIELEQRRDTDALGSIAGSAALREHSGRLSEKQDGQVQTYFIHAPILGRVKIGKSKKVKARFADLSCASAEWLVLLGVLDGDIESKMHARFGKYRVKGEWFDLTGELLRFVQDELRFRQRGGLESVSYTLDPQSAGGIPGRVTLDYEFVSANASTLVEQRVDVVGAR
jgi:hypothetical protein